MKKHTVKNDDDDMLAEYDFASMKGGVRGKYTEKMKKGTNVFLLDADLLPYFPDAETINNTLRSLVTLAKTSVPVIHH